MSKRGHPYLLQPYDYFRGPTPPLAPLPWWFGREHGAGTVYTLGPAEYVGMVPIRKDLEIIPHDSFEGVEFRVSPVTQWWHLGAKSYDSHCTECGKNWNHLKCWDKSPKYPGLSVEEFEHECNWFRVFYYAISNKFGRH